MARCNCAGSTELACATVEACFSTGACIPFNLVNSPNTSPAPFALRAPQEQTEDDEVTK